MGHKSFDQAEEKYRKEVKCLNAVADHVVNSDHGNLQRTLAKAWILAESSDKRILKEAWATIVTKYNLVIENESEHVREGCCDE